MRMGLALATVGVGVSVLVVAVGAHYLLGLSWETAVLLGAITSPTDAAAVFSVLRVVPLPKRLTGALEAESGLNDATVIVIVTIISTGGLDEHGLAYNAGLVVYELLVGLALGLVVGYAGAWVMRRLALPSSGLYPLAVLALCFLSYGGAAALHASGFAAVYVAALVLGNSELPHRAATRSFAEGLAWLSQIGLFVMLGLLLSPGRLDVETVLFALVAGLVLTVVARPLSVAICAVVQPMPVRELTFISWAGLRGAVPIVLATIPLAEGVDDSEAPVRPGLRPRGHRHAGHRTDPAVGGQGAPGGASFGAARPRHRGRAARTRRRRPAPGHHRARPRRCTASRSASSGSPPAPRSR